MTDQFIGILKSTVDAFASSEGYSWSSYIQSTPSRKEWNALPNVVICPSGKEQIKFHAFGLKNIESQYQIFLVSDNKLIDDQKDQHNTFGSAMTALFMPMNVALALAGAWQSRVIVDYDFDRSAFPKSYAISCVEVQISWIQ